MMGRVGDGFAFGAGCVVAPAPSDLMMRVERLSAIHSTLCDLVICLGQTASRVYGECPVDDANKERAVPPGHLGCIDGMIDRIEGRAQAAFVLARRLESL